MLVDVKKDNTVEVNRMDLITGEYIGNPYTVDMSDLKYTDARYDGATAPSFAEGAKVEKTAADGHSITVTFDSGEKTEEYNLLTRDFYL